MDLLTESQLVTDFWAPLSNEEFQWATLPLSDGRRKRS